MRPGARTGRRTAHPRAGGGPRAPASQGMRRPGQRGRPGEEGGLPRLSPCLTRFCGLETGNAAGTKRRRPWSWEPGGPALAGLRAPGPPLATVTSPGHEDLTPNTNQGPLPLSSRGPVENLRAPGAPVGGGEGEPAPHFPGGDQADVRHRRSLPLQCQVGPAVPPQARGHCLLARAIHLTRHPHRIGLHVFRESFKHFPQFPLAPAHPPCSCSERT